ncbi:unnamed protein product [Debaryomyces tyrocola]|nr:unnamed protein product [Debaryomyces tyrocola]
MLSVNLLATAVVGFYASSINAADYETYPTVAHTASINGFADKIYDRLPECAKPCVQQDTGSTPCPYWDPGCLCVMSNWGGPVAECIAENCQGDNVVTATSLATSICSSAGVPSPFWFIPASASADLLEAAEATITDDASSSAAETTEPASSVPATSEPASSEPVTSEPASSEPATTDAPTSDTAENPYATFPTVVRTASINGFADKIYSQLPECAKPCVEEDTGSTPCPYWDPGCLCVMSNWGGPVAECIAENCQGDNVVTATSLATSVCSSAGVPSPYWYIPASASADLLQAAAAATVTGTATSSEPATTEPTSSASATTDAPTSDTAEAISSSGSSVPATDSDGRHINATSTITNKSVPTATVCSSCTKNMPNLNSTKSNGLVVVQTGEILTSSDSNADYTSTSVIGSEATVFEVSTTVVIVTSCESNKCSDISKTTGLTVVTEEHTSYTTYCPLPTESESIVATIVSCDKNTCKSIPTTITSEYDTQPKISKHASSHVTETDISPATTSGANELLSSSSSTAIANESSDSVSDITNNLNHDVTSSTSVSPDFQSGSPISVSSEYSSSSISNAFETATLNPSVFEGSAPVNKQWSLSSLIALFAIALF